MPPAARSGGVYDIPSVFYEVRGAFTNTTPIDAYRGAGKPEANYLIERLVNLASVKTGIDAVELRRRNIVGKFPHRTAMGMKIDGGRFAANLDDAIALADLDGFRKRRKQSRQGRPAARHRHCLLPRNRPRRAGRVRARRVRGRRHGVAGGRHAVQRAGP